jgi:hypothetical protein
MVSLVIPDEALPDLRRIADVDSKDFDALLHVLGETGPALTRAQFENKIAGKPLLPNKDDISAILRAAIAFYRLKESHKFTAQGAAEAIAKSDLVAKSLPVDKIEILRKRLTSLLGFDKSLGVTAKANDVMTEHERVFCSVRILSDIRPVFGEDKEQASGAVVIHNLKIGFHQNGKHKELYFALDTRDIEMLRTAIERASRKTTALASILRKSEVPYIEVPE